MRLIFANARTRSHHGSMHPEQLSRSCRPTDSVAKRFPCHPVQNEKVQNGRSCLARLSKEMGKGIGRGPGATRTEEGTSRHINHQPPGPIVGRRKSLGGKQADPGCARTPGLDLPGFAEMVAAIGATIFLQEGRPANGNPALHRRRQLPARPI